MDVFRRIKTKDNVGKKAAFLLCISRKRKNGRDKYKDANVYFLEKGMSRKVKYNE